MLRILTKAFLRGLGVVLPLSLTLYLLWWLASSCERLFKRVWPHLLPEEWYLPGYGVVLGIALVIGLGIVLRVVLVRRLVAGFERLLAKLPLVKTIYGPLKDLMGFLATGDEAQKANRVVRVPLGDTGLAAVGFVTREDASELTGSETDAKKCAVYLPMSYQIGGYMLLAPRERLDELEMGMEDVLRLTVTAGMTDAEGS